MAIWPFNRKQNQSEDISQEVQDYYQAEKREKVGVAGLLALGTLLVTIVLSMGLFFGGRWVYRTVFNDDRAPQTTQQSNEEEESAQPAPTDSESEEEGDQPAPSTPPAATATPGQGSGSATTTDGSTSGNSQQDGLPQTGPGDTAIIALSAVMFATAGYYAFGGKKNTAS